MIRIDAGSLRNDLATWVDLREAARLDAALHGLDAPPPGSNERLDLEGRVRDHLRNTGLAIVYAAARSAPTGPPGESSRQMLRAASRPCLEWGARDAAAELRARLVDGSPRAGFEVELATASAPSDRDELLARWVQLERDVESSRRAWGQARFTAATSCGAGSVPELLATGEASDASATAERFEHGAIRPLDTRIRDAVRERRRSVGPGGGTEALRCAVLAEHAEAFPLERVAAIVGGVARQLQSAVPCRVVEAPSNAPGSWAEMLVDSGGRPCVLLGGLAGPLSLARALGALGLAMRSEFQRARYGIVSRWFDPGFGFAIETVFRRLVLTGTDILPERDSQAPWWPDLRLQLSLAPRRAWAYLSLAMMQAVRREAVADRAVVDAVLDRALGRSALPGERVACFDADPSGAAELRGTVLGLLIEEWLLTRFGRRWHQQKGALRVLMECWEAESQETVESVAAGLGLGTIDAATIFDRCRP